MQVLTISYKRSVTLTDGNIEEVQISAAVDPEKSPEDEFALLKETVEIALGIHESQRLVA